MHPFLNRYDKALAGYVAHIPAGLTPLMNAVTFIGQPIIVIGIACVLIVGSWLKGFHKIAYAGIGTLIAFGGNTTIKHIVHRSRPDTIYVENMRIHSYSFPSGHTFGSTVVYGLLAYLVLRHLPQPWNYITFGLLITLIILVGISRVFLGAHFPSDVIAGWLLGAISLILIIKLLAL